MCVEFCVLVVGVVEICLEGNVNLEIVIGEIEVNVMLLIVLGECVLLLF